MTLVLAAVSACLAWRAITLGKKQEQLAERQKEVAEKQEAVLDRQLLRTPTLILEAFATHMGSDSLINYDVYIYNSGLGKAAGIKWFMLVPFNSSVRPKFRDGELPDADHTTLNSEKHVKFDGFLDEPVFSRQRKWLCSLEGVKRDNRSLLRWHLVCDEGEFPDAAQYGTLDLSDPAKHVDDFVARNKEAMWWAQ
jgi:hypothetical protein